MSLMNWLESHLFVRSAPDQSGIRADPDPDTITVTGSVADPDLEGPETFGRIRIRSGTEINVLGSMTIWYGSGSAKSS
jgi:hypothetical protein